MDFKTIKKVVSEKYSETEMEIAALGGDVEGVSEMMKAKGLDGDKASNVVQLIRSGMSEEEALADINK